MSNVSTLIKCIPIKFSWGYTRLPPTSQYKNEYKAISIQLITTNIFSRTLTLQPKTATFNPEFWVFLGKICFQRADKLCTPLVTKAILSACLIMCGSPIDWLTDWLTQIWIRFTASRLLISYIIWIKCSYGRTYKVSTGYLPPPRGQKKVLLH